MPQAIRRLFGAIILPRFQDKGLISFQLMPSGAIDNSGSLEVIRKNTEGHNLFSDLWREFI